LIKLSVIIPTFNRKDTLKTTLLSMNAQTTNEFEVIVADDGSTDLTGEMVKEISAALTYPIKHVRQENAGRSAARNMGLEIAAGKYILFIDDHIVVDKNIIQEHINFHEKYSADGVKVIRGRVEFIETASEAPKRNEYIDMTKYKAPHYEQEPFRIFITNNISVEKQALMSVFGFDEDFKEYGLQDAEMGYRLKTAGYKFKMNPNAVGYIFGVGLTFEQRCFRRRQVGRSSVLFYKKHPTFLVKINLSIHWITLMIQKFMAMNESKIPDNKKIFYNFATGIKEGLVKYNDRHYRTMHSRFKDGKKSILFVSHISDLSGAPISLSLLAKKLDKNKYHPIIALPNKGPLTQKLDELGISYQFYKTNMLFSLLPSLKIWQILNDRQIDLVYLNTSATMWAAKPAKLFKAPVVAHIREDLTGIMNTVMRTKISLWSDKIILISKWMKSFIKSDKAVVVHNTVDLDDFNNLSPDKIKKEFALSGKTILFVGSLEDRKGIKYLIQAFNDAFNELRAWLPDTKLLVIGKPLPGCAGYLDKLRSIAKNKDIIFAGPRKDIYHCMAACDILVCPSLSEAFGRVIIEAMACGKPVVATNVGGIPEIVDDGKTGFLVPPKDEDLLAQAIGKLLADDDLSASMGKAGREKVEEHFTTKNQIKEIERVLNEVLR
jgi:glycosyltransferase involved in cell wall biosynthesis/GT2 family glycosyltransferase